MAAGVKKLIIGGGYTAEQAVGYLADPQARGDYYTERGSATMFWLASDRARSYFGLGDDVSRVKLTMLLNGRHPVDGALIRRYGPDGTMVGGIDVTVSPAPKSVSVLWALGDEGFRAELERLVMLSVNAAMGRMLRHVPLVRERYGPGPRDVRHVKAGDWVGVKVLHTTARLSENKGIPDPQLHVHNVLAGALDYAGRLRAIDSRQILLYRSELDAEASADLAERLRRLGFAIERRLVRGRSGIVKRVAWEVAGVPVDLVQAMSSRRQEVEDLREQYRKVTGRDAEGVGWERFLEQHRGPKVTRSAEEMRAAWEAEATTHGFGPDQAATLRDAAAARQEAGVEVRDERSPEAEQLRAEILADLCRKHALVPERELDKLLAQRSIGLMDPYQAMRVVARMFGDGDLLSTTDGRVTTLEVLAAEQRATAAAQRLLDAEPSAPAARAELEREFRRVEEDGAPFDDRQRHAVELATSGARLVSITGPAGTGKGHASGAMTAIWQRQGRRVIAGAIQGITAQQTEADSGADDGRTLAGLRWAIETGSLRLEPSDVLLVDEAAMIDHHSYAPLLEAVADAGATLVQVGDDKQLSPVEAGGLWTVIHGMAGVRDQAVSLREVRRARNPAEALAWTDLREGRVEEAIRWYRDEGLLRLYDTRSGLLAGMLEEWWGRSERGVMVVDSSNEERDRLNELAQARRLEVGELGADALTLENGRSVRAGDRVLFNSIYRLEPGRPDEPRPRRVENGTLATVVSVDLAGGTAALRLHEPQRERDGRGRHERKVTVPTSAPLELGYARHVVKAQGMTTEVANVATGPHTRHNELYTMITRSRDGTRIHALRAELEDMGVDPATLAGSGSRAAESAPTVEDLLRGTYHFAELQAALRLREAEAATIREMARRAEWSSTKEAIGDQTWVAATRKEASRRHFTSTVEAERGLSEMACERELDRTATQQHEPDAHRRPAPAARRVEALETMPLPMPAHEAIESVARSYARDRDAARVLACYQVIGRLSAVADPVAHAVERWRSDRGAVIVVDGENQKREVLEAAERLRAEAGDAGPGPAVVLATVAYQEREERRRAWREAERLTRGDLVEPGVAERAYVLAPDHHQHDHLVRGLSVAAQSYLVTTPPNAWVASHAAAEVDRMRESMGAKARAEQVRQTALAAELLADRGHSASREMARTAGRQMETESIGR